MKNLFATLIGLFVVLQTFAQTNIICTNPTAQEVMKGNYNPANYLPAQIVSHPDSVMQLIMQQVSPDSIHALLNELNTFYTRNSASDTISPITGIGAARRWAFQKFAQIGANPNSRLLPSYLQFDNTAAQMCGVLQHRNIFAVLPGSDTSDKSMVIVEAHLDSRCKVLCDTACFAAGMEDNGSGTALVLELARVMSKCVFKRTIVFLLLTGEEQGLYGAEAFARYAEQQNIPIHAVLNNDVIGGIFCGMTSSPPSCPVYAHIDSTHVRLFSFGGYNSPHKQFARFVKLEYKEQTLPYVSVPHDIMIMTAEDRTGRGGDHIPFRQHLFTAIRMTAANENGSANVADTAYHDRQHTSDDILGLDTDGIPGLDSFFVDFNYLGRNTVINATGIAMAAAGPLTPDFDVVSHGTNNAIVTITQQTQYPCYRIGVRTLSNDWDSVYTFCNKLTDTLTLPFNVSQIFSVAAVDNEGIESLFSHEEMLWPTGIYEKSADAKGIHIIANIPNPSDEQTLITIYSNKELQSNACFLSVTDIAGREIKRLPLQLKTGINEVLFNHGFQASGLFTCTLYCEGIKKDMVKMMIGN